MVKPTPAEPAEGTQLGRYRLRYKVAQGGMAAVYLAQLEGLHGFERWVAIKIVHQHLAADRRFTTMLLDEARVAAQIHHPNVCAVTDYGEQDGAVYLVMEYLHGESYASVIRRAVREGEHMPYWLPARIAADAARGLHAAHELRDARGLEVGVVHRDVSPQNILVLYDGMSKVVDFGIARARGRLTATEQGETKGKFAYMSPEQLQSSDVDRRADVWALGVVLWESTVGRRLFRAESQGRTVMKVVTAPIPRPSELRAEYPKRLEEVIMRALDRDVDARWHSTGEMADALEIYLYSGGEPAGAGRVATWMKAHFPDKLSTRDAMLRSLPGAATVAEVELESQSSIGSHRRVSADGDDRLSEDAESEAPPSGAPARAAAPGSAPAQLGDFADEPGPLEQTVADAMPPMHGGGHKPGDLEGEPTSRGAPAALVPPPASRFPKPSKTGADARPRPRPFPPTADPVSPASEPPVVAVAAPPDAAGDTAAHPAARTPARPEPLPLPRVRQPLRKAHVTRAWALGVAGVLFALVLIALAFGGGQEPASKGFAEGKRGAPKSEASETRVAPMPEPGPEPAGEIQPEAVAPEPEAVAVPEPAQPEPDVTQRESEETQRESEETRRETVADARERPRNSTRREPREPRSERQSAEPGRLNLLAVPRAEVFLGSRRLGTTPLVDFELPAGYHRLTLREIGGSLQKSVRVQIRPGARSAMSVRLDEPSAR